MDSFNNEVCDKCGKLFSTRRSLVRHKKLHDGIKSFKCNTCDKNFARKDEMIIHMKIHVGDTKKLSVCQLCGKSFPDKKLLILHRREHISDKEYHCTVCSLIFRKKFLLNLHMKEHKTYKEYKCNICSNVFRTNFMLNQHKKQHKILTKYKCEECSQIFTNKVNLLNHTKVSHKACTVKKVHDDGNHICKKLTPTKSALNMFFTYIINPSAENDSDFIPFFKEARPKLKCTLLHNICEKGALKWYCIVKVICSKSVGQEMEYANPFFRSNCVAEYNEENIDQHISEAFRKMINSFENFTEKGSGWVLERMQFIELSVVKLC